MTMSFPRAFAFVAAVLSIVVGAAVPSPSRADEGMWTFDRFPTRTVAQRYHVAPSTAWLGHVQRAVVNEIEAARR